MLAVAAQAQVLTVRVGAPPPAPTLLVNTNDVWSYRKGTSEPQADWLRGLGIEDLVAEGRAVWEAAAAAPDLAAIAGRSRGPEAAALTDPDGLGAHSVLTLVRH